MPDADGQQLIHTRVGDESRRLTADESLLNAEGIPKVLAYIILTCI